MSKSEWEWFGHPAHYICGHDCVFHLATLVGGGKWMVSTVGEYWPDMVFVELYARAEGIALIGKGDARRDDARRKLGYLDIGVGRKYETMVFRASEARCKAVDCGCNLPEMASLSEVDADGYNDAGSATRGHMAMCQKWDAGLPGLPGLVKRQG